MHSERSDGIRVSPFLRPPGVFPSDGSILIGKDHFVVWRALTDGRLVTRVKGVAGEFHARCPVAADAGMCRIPDRIVFNDVAFAAFIHENSVVVGSMVEFTAEDIVYVVPRNYRAGLKSQRVYPAAVTEELHGMVNQIGRAHV